MILVRLSEKTIAYLADIMERHLTHYNLRILISKLELDTSYLSEGEFTKTSFSKHAYISNLLSNLSDLDNPSILEKFIQLLNIMISEYEMNQIESLKTLLEPYGITIIKEEDSNRYEAILTVPKIPKVEQQNGSLLDKLLPENVSKKLNFAIKEYQEGEFRNVISNCRSALHEFSIVFHGNDNFKNFIDSLREKGIIRENEKVLVKKLYDYLSSFAPLHGTIEPDQDQALYALKLTNYTLVFLAKKVRRYHR